MLGEVEEDRTEIPVTIQLGEVEEDRTEIPYTWER
jgi:hypothetical protein